MSFPFNDCEFVNKWTFLLQPHGDNDSETSIESNTSDSGRGGSESDIHSSGGLSQCQELGKIRTDLTAIKCFIDALFDQDVN